MNNALILTNKKDYNHFKEILSLFENAEEIWLATAFLKSSGQKLLEEAIQRYLSKGGLLKIIAGKHFGLTEPKALYDLYKISYSNNSVSLFLDKATSATRVFHPKLFVFIKDDKATVISGSANITKGGLADNEEISLRVEVPTSSDSFLELKQYFTMLTCKENAEVLNLLSIKRYEKFFRQQQEARKQQKVIPPKASEDFAFDYSKLKEWLKTYDLKEFKKVSEERERDYEEALKLLDEIATNKSLSKKRFEEIIDDLVGKKGQYGLWRSGSLRRLRFKVYRCKNEFVNLVKFIKSNLEKSAGEVFELAKPYVAQVSGARMNYVAEIMMTYAPQRFANLNSNPIKVLDDEAGVYFKSHSSSFNADDYSLYCEVIKEICRELGLKNMLEADSFFNEIYWELKNR